MNFVMKNIKQVGIFNSLLLVVSVVLVFVKYIISDFELLYFITDVVYMAAVVSAFVYAIKGYKKDAAKYYKTFFVLYALYTVVHLVSDISVNIIGNSSKVFTNEILLTLVSIDALVLAFGKDLGKKKSIGLAYALLVIQFISSARIYALYNGNRLLYIVYYIKIVLACIACVFVEAKYADKEARGTK